MTPLASAGDTPVEAAVRAEVRPWMQEHAARFGPTTGSRQRWIDSADHVAACREWQRELDTGGWSVVRWPVTHGGRGYGPVEARVVHDEMHRFDVPVGAFQLGVDMVGPTLLAHGTREQVDALLPAIRTGAHVWCQLFSEPDAGSDLASLRTRATRDGDEWVVSGTKVWTSGARHADRAILLARTDPASRGRDGITYFVVDMTTPGIDVRPIVQINRAAHFNETILDDVRLPLDAAVGAVGDGWAVARTTLAAERAMIGSIRLDDRVTELVDAARRAGRSGDRVLRQELAGAYARAMAVRLTADRVLTAVRLGGAVGAEASVLKLGTSTTMGVLGDLAVRVLGTDGLLAGDGTNGYGPMQDAFLSQWAPRIGGGTEQIQRTMIGERALGLPREPPAPR